MKALLTFFFPIMEYSKIITKLRVGFDGCARSSSSVSLNDIKVIGPTIQNDLLSTLLRFRTHDIVVCRLS